MCLKRVYYNTYGDESVDVTERVETCRPGKMCSNPEVRTYERKFRFSKLEDTARLETPASLAERKPTPYHVDPNMRLPPTLDKSGGQSPARKARSPGIYVNRVKISEINTNKAPKDSPSRLKIKRTDDVMIQQDRQPRSRERKSHHDQTRNVPFGSFFVLEDLGSRSSRSRACDDSPPRRMRQKQCNAERSTPAPPHVNVVFVDDERRPLQKSLRWQDHVEAERTAQNARIANRPKPDKGILKNGNKQDMCEGSHRSGRNMNAHGGQENISGREDEEEYWDRLRERLEQRQNSRVYYPGEGVYNCF